MDLRDRRNHQLLFLVQHRFENPFLKVENLYQIRLNIIRHLHPHHHLHRGVQLLMLLGDKLSNLTLNLNLSLHFRNEIKIETSYSVTSSRPSLAIIHLHLHLHLAKWRYGITFTFFIQHAFNKFEFALGRSGFGFGFAVILKKKRVGAWVYIRKDGCGMKGNGRDREIQRRRLRSYFLLGRGGMEI